MEHRVHPQVVAKGSDAVPANSDSFLRTLRPGRCLLISDMRGITMMIRTLIVIASRDNKLMRRIGEWCQRPLQPLNKAMPQISQNRAIYSKIAYAGRSAIGQDCSGV